jgi:CheY-like chemotaxis protein
MNAPRFSIILLASCNQQLAYLIQRYAGNCGCQLLRAEYGVSVTSAIAQNRPDVILLDVSQANPEGLLTLRELKSRPETRLVPVILCATSETDWLNCEAEGRLLQPILFGEFVIAVEEAGIQIPKNAKEV